MLETVDVGIRMRDSTTKLDVQVKGSEVAQLEQLRAEAEEACVAGDSEETDWTENSERKR